MSAQLDHLVIAARTLDEGREWLEDRFKVPLQPGGEHSAFGTHNLLLSLGPTAYLEVIAINPAAPVPDRPRWFGLDTPDLNDSLQDGPQLIHWVAQVSEPLSGSDALELSRGENRWQLTVPADGHLPAGGTAPSLIYWHTPPPPTRLPDAGIRLLMLHLSTPDPNALRETLRQLDFQGTIEVHEAVQATLATTLQTPSGPVELVSYGR